MMSYLAKKDDDVRLWSILVIDEEKNSYGERRASIKAV